MRRPIMILGLLLLLLGVAFLGARLLERFVVASKGPRTAAAKNTGNNENVTFSAEEWATIKKLSPLPPLPSDKTNKYLDSSAAARFAMDAAERQQRGEHGLLCESAIRSSLAGE